MWLPMLAFSFAILIQVFYYLRYFRLLAFHKDRQQLSEREQAVSVVICARDEADEIEANLPGVLAQTYRSTHEIVVVNDNSQDDTKYLLEGLYRDFKQLHIVELKQEALHIPGKKFPLSMGIKSAKYELLLLTDADCIPASEHWILKMQAAFKEGIQIVLGYGAYKRKKGCSTRLFDLTPFIQRFSICLVHWPGNLIWELAEIWPTKGNCFLNRKVLLHTIICPEGMMIFSSTLVQPVRIQP